MEHPTPVWFKDNWLENCAFYWLITQNNESFPFFFLLFLIVLLYKKVLDIVLFVKKSLFKDFEGNQELSPMKTIGKYLNRILTVFNNNNNCNPSSLIIYIIIKHVVILQRKLFVCETVAHRYIILMCLCVWIGQLVEQSPCNRKVTCSIPGHRQRGAWVA